MQPFPAEMRKIVLECLERNYAFGHSENILVAMLVDENESVREEAVARIKSSRQIQAQNKEAEQEEEEEEVNTQVRIFEKQNLNWNAENYWQLCRFEDPAACDPPLLRLTDIDTAILDVAALKKLLDYPCHSQVNEFLVQETHKALAFTSDVEQVMGIGRVRAKARLLNPVLKKKADYAFDPYA